MRNLVLAALLAASPAAADELDEDFEPPPTRSIALGPVQRGRVVLSLDFGYLRSGARADLGVSDTLSLVARVETLAFDYGFPAQNAVYAGMRWSLLGGESTARLSVTGEVGPILHEGHMDYAVRGEVAAGAVFELASPYVRAAVRGLSYDVGEGGSFAYDTEVAAGVERRLGKVILGAEGSLWLRPSLDALPQWRLRAAYAF